LSFSLSAANAFARRTLQFVLLSFELFVFPQTDAGNFASCPGQHFLTMNIQLYHHMLPLRCEYRDDVICST
ncbi:hypothetical protein BKA62DRAFT_694048, partial [Auriculariales sp. MPI-PUGE-AT-0066]